MCFFVVVVVVGGLKMLMPFECHRLWDVALKESCFWSSSSLSGQVSSIEIVALESVILGEADICAKHVLGTWTCIDRFILNCEGLYPGTSKKNLVS